MIRNCSVLLIALPLAGCYGLYGNDEFDRYFQRSNTITMSAGDAKDVNAVAQTIHPWPPYVNNPRLAYDGRRAVGAVTRYGRMTQPTDQLPDISDATKQMGQKPPTETIQNVNSNINGNSYNTNVNR
jgi:hypothetical protein